MKHARRSLSLVLVAALAATLAPTVLAQRTPARRRARAHPPESTTTSSAAPRDTTPPPAPPGPPPTRAIAIAAGGDHSCALTADHRVFCWGVDQVLTNLMAQTILGPRATPTELVRSQGATALALEGTTPIVQMGDGRIVSYGSWAPQALGHLAHSPEDWQADAAVFDQVPPGITLVEGGDGAMFCALQAGVLRCQGSNNFGQLGAGLEADVSATLVPVVGLTGVRAAATSGQTTCAIDAQGLWCWGRGDLGTLGSGLADEVHTPRRVALEGAVSVAISRQHHACAIDASGAVWCWGNGTYGEIGNPTGTIATPRVVVGVTGATAVAVGEYSSCVISGGAVWCWGAGNAGQLGDGRATGSGVPVQVSNLSGVTQIALGDTHACALDAAGAVWCWGNNARSSCGVPGASSYPTPVRVFGP